MQEINVEKIMEDIRKEIKASGKDQIPLSFSDKGSSSSNSSEALNYLSTHYEIEPYEYLTGNKIKVFVKKVIRKLNSFVYLPVVREQNTLNYYYYKIIESCNETNKENDKLEDRIDSLERRIKALEDSKN